MLAITAPESLSAATQSPKIRVIFAVPSATKSELHKLTQEIAKGGGNLRRQARAGERLDANGDGKLWEQFQSPLTGESEKERDSFAGFAKGARIVSISFWNGGSKKLLYVDCLVMVFWLCVCELQTPLLLHQSEIV